MVGLTGGGILGGYETQLGNVAILIPAFKLLKKSIPDAKIWTTVQLTDKFCKEHGVTRIPNPKRISPSFLRIGLRLITYLTDLFRASLWRFIRDLLKINFRLLISSNRLEQFAQADVVLDFNGDIFPSDSHPILVFLNAVEIVTIRQLGIPVVEFISSPGPFNTWFRRAISKFKFNKISVFANREPVSSELVKQLGIKDIPIVNTACPAFMLDPVPAERSKEILTKENVDINRRPLIGMTLAGYNLSSERTWGQLKKFDDLKIYVPAIKFLLDDLNANIILLPHVYRMNPYTYGQEHINGPDYDILLNLYKMVGGEKYGGRIKLIEGKYSASEAKGMIGQCDMYLSGRLHAGVAALSQSIPTILLAYGHKHYGFASLVGQEKYVFNGKDAKTLESLILEAWENRVQIASVIRERMKRVEELVNMNFEIVKEIVELNRDQRNNIPVSISAAWVKKAENELAKL